MRKMVLILTGLVFVFSCVFSVYVKGTIIENAAPGSEGVLDLPVSSSMDEYSDLYMENASVENMDSLMQESTLVVKVIALDEGESRPYSILRKCRILNTYKGKASSEIEVYEPCYISRVDYDLVMGYVPMKQGEEYVLFLSPVENDGMKGYENAWYFVSASYGKYQPGLTAEASEDWEVFRDVKDSAFVTTEEEEAEKYNRILKEVETLE